MNDTIERDQNTESSQTLLESHITSIRPLILQSRKSINKQTNRNPQIRDGCGEWSENNMKHNKIWSKQDGKSKSRNCK